MRSRPRWAAFSVLMMEYLRPLICPIRGLGNKALKTDEELLYESRDGDTGSFRELVQRLEPYVAATVIGMLGRGPEAEDIGQETFIRFYKALDSFRGESSVRTFVTRIAINLSINELRKRKFRMFSLSESATEPVLQGRMEPADRFEDRELVEKSLNHLSASGRAVVVLRLVEGYSTKEVAEILKIPVGTVLSRLARAQMKLVDVIRSLSSEQSDERRIQKKIV